MSLQNLLKIGQLEAHETDGDKSASGNFVTYSLNRERLLSCSRHPPTLNAQTTSSLCLPVFRRPPDCL